MKKAHETIIDESGIELTVGYAYEKSPSQIEECHGQHEVGELVYTELRHVEIIIKGRGIDILPLLTGYQKEYIISLLNYEE